MTDQTAAAPGSGAAAPSRAPTRSMGQKLLLVCGLALLMTIPALFVFGLLADRTNRAQQVEHELGELVGGPQTFMGPVLAIPFHPAPGPVGAAVAPIPVSTPPPSPYADTAAGPPRSVQGNVLLVFPSTAEVNVSEASEVRKRSLFRVPVYKAGLSFRAHFDLSQISAPANAVLEWDQAEFLMGASDARGAQAEATMALGGRTVTLAPATLLSELPLQSDESGYRRWSGPWSGGGSSTLRFFGVGTGGFAKPGAVFDTAANMKFSGARRLSLLPFGKTTVLNMRGDWPYPSFDGGFLPVTRKVSPNGFTAEWNVPFIARGVPAEGHPDVLARLGRSNIGVTFAEPANPYQSVARSLKYALLFVGLVFLAYFLFEATSGKRVHPAQYVLIGLTQIIFYLLLLSIAERIGFDLGFLIAAGATVGLISAYAGWIFDSRKQGIRALVAFTFLYGLIYVLMRLEDYALLVGAVSSFAAIAAVMYFTRKLDWYGVTGSASTSAGRAPPLVLKESQ